MENIPLINGRAYSFVDVVVKIAGVPTPSVSKINYTEEQQKENNYGTGSRPVSRGAGKIEAKASIEISMNDVEAIRDVAPNGSLLALPSFDIEVHFLNAQKVVTHVIKNCEFTTDGVEAGTDDKDIKMSFDLIPSHILYR
jgi:hypothetical protein